MPASDTLGILAGLSTALLWTVTAVCFESASRRLGSLAVNLLRLLLAVLLFAGLSLYRAGTPLPPGLSGAAWFYLGLSGLVGFVIGDLLLFQAFVLIGARLSMVIYAGTPLLTALAGFLFLGETLSPRDLAGMGVVVVGIALAVMGKPSGAPRSPATMATRTRGILYAIGGTAGQAAGLLLGKHGVGSLDSFTGTQVRALFGLGGFVVVVLLARQARTIGALFPPLFRGADRPLRRAFLWLALGSVFGPFLGVSLGLLATQRLPTGIASTLMSLVPVLLIPVSALAFKEKAGTREIVGALLAVGGVALLAW